MILVFACVGATTTARAEDSFPQTATRTEVLRWLTTNTDLNINAVAAMTDEVVVAITDRQDGRGVEGSIRLALREEVISPDAAAAWGGRSILLDMDLDCSRPRVMLGVRRIYASPDLQGSVRLSRADSAWSKAPPGTVIDEVVHAVCAPQPPAQLATAQTDGAGPPPQISAAEPSPAANARFGTPARSPPAPIKVAAADTSPPPQPTVEAPPPRPVAVVPPEIASAPRESSARPVAALVRPVERSVVVHSPFAGLAASPAAKPAPRGPTTAAAPAPRSAEFAVQIAAAASADLAINSWQSLKARFPGLVAPRTFAVEPVSDKGRTVYRALLLGFASQDDAAALCKTLLSQSADCALRQLR